MYKSGELVNCELLSCARDGYIVALLPERRPAFLRSANIWPIGKMVSGAFVLEADNNLIFAELPPPDGLAIRLEQISQQVNALHLGIDLSSLSGNFDDNLLAILAAWHDLNLDTVQYAHSEAGLVGYLIGAALLPAAQLATITTGEKMVNEGALTFRQFAVAYRDQIDGCISFQESLEVRHWAPDSSTTPASSTAIVV